MEHILEVFPELSDTAAAAIAHAFQNFWMNDQSKLGASDERAAIIGFAAGWIARPTSDFTGN